MTFDAIFEITSDHDVDGYRQIEANDLQDAKIVLRSTLDAEGIAYVIHALRETDASFAARRAA